MAEIINSLSLSLRDKLKTYYFNEFQKSGGCSSSPSPSPTPTQRETFMEGINGESVVANENRNIQEATDDYYRSAYANESLVKYQYDVYDSISFFNTILFMLYVLLFLYILVMLLRQYTGNVVRNMYLDIFLVILMAIYPFVISTLEIYLYKIIKYLFSGILIFGYAFLRLFQRNI